MTATSPGFFSPAKMGDCSAEKSAMRRRILSLRHQMGDAARQQASRDICERIRQLPQYQQARCIAAFAPMAEEVNIWSLITESLQQKKTVALPRVADKSQRQLSFHLFRGRDKLIAGYKKILEPPREEKNISPQLFDFIFIPAVAVDKNKIRLGYGGGFYDRVLANCETICSCTPVFQCQLVDVLPHEKHDQSVQLIISG